MSNTLPSPRPALRNHYLLMRHAHSQANQQGVIISHPDNGLGAFGLSSHGQAQLDTLLADWAWPTPTRILHSDFLRTTETAARLAGHFDVAMSADARLRERDFGELERQADSHYPTVWVEDIHDPKHTRYGVESVAHVAQRMRAVIDSLEQAYQGETLLVVSHGDPLQILLTALEARALNEHRERPLLTPASITPLGGA